MSEKITNNACNALLQLGRQIRAHRKGLGINATAAAEAAGMSRVTLHRIERGEPSVNIGAYVNAMLALGMNFLGHAESSESKAGLIPARIRIDGYPQLKKLAWQLKEGVDLTPIEALGMYERNWRHIDQAALELTDRQLIDALRLGLGEGKIPDV